jgi:hypothetical protein
VILAVALFGVFLVALGLTGMASPPRLFAFVARWQSQPGLYTAAGIRILLGVALILAAPDSRAPHYLQAFGGIALLAGVATPFFGLRRFAALLAWWREQDAAIVRLWCLVVTLVGCSFVWAVFPAPGAG